MLLLHICSSKQHFYFPHTATASSSFPYPTSEHRWHDTITTLIHFPHYMPFNLSFPGHSFSCLVRPPGEKIRRWFVITGFESNDRGKQRPLRRQPQDLEHRKWVSYIQSSERVVMPSAIRDIKTDSLVTWGEKEHPTHNHERPQATVPHTFNIPLTVRRRRSKKLLKGI